ncbi:hypothetical protein EV426DRAFT_427788 [Tirmania nivea]|nr:hypothetical protein EV426DRAFT_427788 [Tirmania nivea]
MAGLLSYLPDDIATAPRNQRKRIGGIQVGQTESIKDNRRVSKYAHVDSEDDVDLEAREEEDETMTPIEPPEGNKHLLNPKAIRTYSSPPPLSTVSQSLNTLRLQDQQPYVAYSPQFAPVALNKRKSGSSLRLRAPEELPQLHDGNLVGGPDASGKAESSSKMAMSSENSHMHIEFTEGPNLTLGNGELITHRPQLTHLGPFQPPSLLSSTYVGEGSDGERYTSSELAASSRHSGNFGNRHSFIIGPAGNYGTRESLDYDTGEETENPTIGRRGFFSKLKALGHTAAHGRNPSGWTVDTLDDSMRTPQVGAADYESENERAGGRRSFSPSREREARTAPTTPKSGVRRRATMTDIPEEGLERRRPSSSHAKIGGTLPRRFPGLDYFRYHAEGGDPQASGEGSNAYLKWQKLKDSLKAMGRSKKEESKVDREKSAELVAELTAGTPAVAMLASMFQRDEHGNKRIPVLLEQLKVRIVDSRPPGKGASRYHAIFRIELEYGSGLTRMTWAIHREFRDFVNLHSRYKLADISNTTFSGRGEHKLPKFPRGTIPYLRGVRGLGSDDDDEEQSAPEDVKSPDTPGGGGLFTPATSNPNDIEEAQQQHGGMSATAPIPPNPKSSRVPFFGGRKPQTSGTLTMDVTEGMPGIATGIAAAGIGTLAGAIGGGGSTLAPLTSRRDTFAIRQRQKLEEYLQGLIRIMIFRPDSNRLCKFLELSALGVRLAAENSYHGKEGYLIIRSAKGSDFRKGWTPAAVAQRHRPKWFLVRHSYIVCVDSPEEMNIYDVFLVDHNFEVDAKKFLSKKSIDPSANTSNNAPHAQHHSLTIKNTERTIKLLAKHERQLQQFYESITYMKEKTVWAKQNRLGSFAPVRKNVFAQWLVDGRDYMWNVSRAISMAKDVIYIHDWWLSPELYLRRPAAVSQKWRLDRLLQKKAQEGVKIFVIVYRNIGAAIPIDSSYTKYSLLDLHPNVFVQRSPNQIRQNTFFWAHHEKILVVDHVVAFVGGIDLCFGRWDTPQHSLRDDRPTGFDDSKGDPDNFQLWPGKDYSNPRVQDFYGLDKPYEEMYDRSKVPRMGWHDISMQLVGQPARDLTRHFVQRWNYLLRQRKPSRPTPVLLPPPDFTEEELQSLGIEGTCEIQILRSSCAWSMGTPYVVEHSIMNAYLKAIETSDHFVYIENQFFITSCEWEGTKIENSIGDALVERIIRAHKNDEDWRAIILIPLMPGFQNSVDSQDGTSIRLIMQCQYRSISRGDSSIFGKLKAQGIEPEDFIQFYGLRNWGKIGPEDALVTEQLYIHAKCMVVDDRIAIIGSANINERSMLGNRDSEVAAIVRDTDTIMSTMAGKPYRVGKFPHSLRLRLMREHLGIDVDEIMSEERRQEVEAWEREMNQWSAEVESHAGSSINHDGVPSPPESVDGHIPDPDGEAGDSHTPRASMFASSSMKPEAVQRSEGLRSFNHDVDWEQENSPFIKSHKKISNDVRISENPKHKEDVEGKGADRMNAKEEEKKKKSKENKGKFSLRGLKGADGDKKGKSKAAGFTRNSLPPWETRSLASTSNSNGVARPPSTSQGRQGGRPRADTATTTASSTSRATDTNSEASGYDGFPPHPGPGRKSSQDFGLPLPSQLPPLPRTNDFDIGGPSLHRPSTSSATRESILPDMVIPHVEADIFIDPLNDAFYLDVWHACALNNTKIFRDVFRCMPDNEVKTWKEYKEYAAYKERFSQSQTSDKCKMRRQQEASGKIGPPGTSASNSGGHGMFNSIGETLNEKLDQLHSGEGPDGEVLNAPNNSNSWGSLNSREKGGDNFSFVEKPGSPNSQDSLSVTHLPPASRGNDIWLPASRGNDVPYRSDTLRTTKTSTTADHTRPPASRGNDGRPFSSSTQTTFAPSHLDTSGGGLGLQPSVRRRRRNTKSSRREFHANDDMLDKETSEMMLEKVQGHLVVWPYDWLIKAEDAGNWLYSIDQLAPIEIYN